jgi:hypothetical protein
MGQVMLDELKLGLPASLTGQAIDRVQSARPQGIHNLTMIHAGHKEGVTQQQAHPSPLMTSGGHFSEEYEYSVLILARNYVAQLF